MEDDKRGSLAQERGQFTVNSSAISRGCKQRDTVRVHCDAVQPKPLKAKNNSPTTKRPRITTKGRSSFSPLGVLFIKGHIAKPVLFSLRGDTPLALSPREHIAKSDPFSTTGIRPLALLWRCISRNGHIHCTGFAPFLRFRALERRLPR